MRRSLFLFLSLAACGQSGVITGDDAASPPDAAAPVPDGIPADAVVPDVATDVDGLITINEVMAANVYTLHDGDGQPGDWIELYNPNEADVPLWGYTLTDDLADPDKHVFLQGIVVPAKGRVIVWLDDNPTAGPTHVGFKLARGGGAIGLARPDGSWIDRVTYGEQGVDFSAARSPDGSSAWTIEWHPTPGEANHAGPGAPMGMEDPAAAPEAIPAAGDLSERLYRTDTVPELALVISNDGMAALAEHPFAYVDADIVFDGRSYGPVGVRLKGANSFQPITGKPSLRLQIDHANEDARFFHLKDMTLNNLDDDASMMHERIAYWVARSAGVPASRANHVRLSINGHPYGLYSNVETVKKQMVGRWFADSTGPLFEATDVDFRATDVARYELENGPDDRTLLAGLAEALTNPDPDAAIAAASAYIDMDEFWTFWAVLSVIGQFDSFPYSIPGDDYFLYADPTTSRLHVIPWGMDETFLAGDVDVTNVSSVLATKCKASPSCFASYVEHTWAVLALAEQLGLEAERARVAAQIQPFAVSDPKRLYAMEDVTAFQSSMYWFIKGRRARLDGYLP